MLQFHGYPCIPEGLRVWCRAVLAMRFNATLADGYTLPALKILVAVGRCPQVEGLGLAEIGSRSTRRDGSAWAAGTLPLRQAYSLLAT